MTTITPPPGLAEMVALPNWVGFKREARPGESKPTKIPYQVAQDERGRDVKAKAGDRTTWDTWPALAAALEAGRFDGPGFEFHEDDGLVGIDIDNCRDPETGALTPLARAVVCLADTYAEPSISGTGIHIIGAGELPRPLIAADRQGKNKGGREMYGGAHFFTMSFEPFPQYDTPHTIDAETMRRLFLLLWPDEATPKPAPTAPRAPVAPITLDDAALLEKAFAAKNGADFHARHQGGYLLEDKSADDFAYLGELRFWTQGDPGRMRRIALSSSRVREKWPTRRGASDWLDYTITKSLDGVYAVYNPTAPTAAPPTGGASPSHDEGNADPELVATLRADVARLGDALRRAREEGARLVARVTELETENAALEAAIRHPVQSAGIGTLDQVEAAQRAYQRGEVVTLGGQDFARVPATTAAKRRSAKTLTTGLKSLIGLTPGDRLPREPVAFGRDQAFAVFARAERIETPTFKGDVDIAYLHIPEALRGQRGKAVLGILPTCAGAKQHGGRRTIAVPPEVAARPHPVKRERELVTRWYDALTNAKIVTEAPTLLGTDYWTAQGEQRTAGEIEAIRIKAGYQPAPAKPWQPTQPPRRIGPDPEPRQDAEVSTTPPEGGHLHGGAWPAHEQRAEPRQLADIYRGNTSRQDAEVSPHPEPRQDAEVSPLVVEDIPGVCQDPDCGNRAIENGYCREHYPVYVGWRVQAGAYDYAAGAD